MARDTSKLVTIPGELHSAATGNIVAAAEEVFDYTTNKYQKDINQEVAYIKEDRSVDPIPSFNPQSQTVHVDEQVLSNAQKKQVRKNIGLGNGDIDSTPTSGSDNVVRSGGVYSSMQELRSTVNPQVGYYTCSTAGDTAAKVIDASGYTLLKGGGLRVNFTEKNTAANATLNIEQTGAKPLYYNGVRVSTNNSWYAGEVMTLFYDGAAFQLNSLPDLDEYDVSAKNGGRAFTFDEAVALVPEAYRHGGLKLRFISNSDSSISGNKYVQYRLMKNTWSTTVSNWQGLDDEPTAGSDNLVKSGGVADSINNLEQRIGKKFTDLDKKFQGVLYEDLNGKTSKNLIDSNTVWTDGKYVSTLSGDLDSLNSLSVTDFIPVSSGKIIFYTYDENILNGGQALAIYDSSKRTIYDSSSSPYFSSLQHIEGYIYSVDLPANAAYVRINVKTTEKSLAFINFVYNSDTKLSLSWLLLQDEQIPQILPNKIFSDNFIFEQEEYIVQNYTEGGYISVQNKNVGAIIKIDSNNNIHSAIIPVQEGDVLLVKYGQNIDPSGTLAKFYYAFGFTDNPLKSCVAFSDYPNYISAYNDTQYLIHIPKDCGYFYLTMTDNKRADDNVKFCVVKQNLKWLEISQDNMSQEAVSAIISSMISNKSFSTSVANISENSQQTREAEYHLWDSICKKIEFNGKVIKFFGDSITAGTCSPNLGNAGNERYSSMFCRLVGASEQNYGIGGSCITDSQAGDQYNIGTRVKQYVQSTDQIIIIAGGTNDFNQGKTIGTFGDTQRTTFYGSLNDICSHIKTTAPDAVVIFITPIPYTKPESEYPSHIASLNEYRSAIYDVATKYGYNVVDGNSIGMPKMQGGWNNFMCDDSDGCHPTIEGHKLMARNLCGKLL